MKPNISIAIYGAGGQARVAASIIRRLGGMVYGYFDDSFDGEEIIDGAPVMGMFRDILNVQSACQTACVAVGDNRKRQQAFFFLNEHGFHLPPLVHPQALVETDAMVGEGSVVCLGAMLGTKAVIGRGVIINTGASVDHESCIGDFAHLAPQAAVAGRTVIGEGTFIGMSAAIADRLNVGDWAVIGAGSVIIRDVPGHQTYVGVPAKRIA
jgi:sugar O-acyltransferase (sialic acid O-acetyltransferase NeuD family)